MASMGPPDFSGGIGAQYLDGAARHDASMGPPDFSGGIVDADGSPHAYHPLQWGRLISQAESRQWTENHVVRRSLLQWGRLISQAESSDAGAETAADAGLQWGRLISQAESELLHQIGIIANMASMGPPDFSGGIAERRIIASLDVELQWGRLISQAESKMIAAPSR